MANANSATVSEKHLTKLNIPEAVPPHPRLLASKVDWERIRKQIQSDPVSARIFASLENRAKQLLKDPPVERVMIGRRLLDTSRLALARIGTLAMVFHVTREKAYADRAAKEMLAAASFPDWNPSHFLDAAEMSLALAIGYDWLYDSLSEAERHQVAKALVEKGLKPSEAAKHDWIDGNNNWNQVCHAGMSAAAIAIADLQPELAERILNRAIENVPKSAHAYAPDGAYPEGPIYWEYGTSYHIVLAAALQQFSVSAFGLDSVQGLKESATYMAEVTGPSGLFFDYADSAEKRGLQIPLFWLARNFQHPEWLRMDIQKLNELLNEDDKPDSRDPNARMLALALLWRDPSLVDDFKNSPPLNWLGRGNNPVAIHRSAFGDPSASYVGMKGGSPSVPHAHMDVSSFVLEADGVRWAIDLGKDDYSDLEAKNIDLWDGKQEGARWSIFRLGAESHNILRFNGAPQAVSGSAQFVRFQSEGPQPHSVLNLSALYRDQVKEAHRGVMLLPDKTVLFQDEWTAADKPVDAAWQMLTRAKVTVLPGEIRLEQNGKALTLQILEPAHATVEVKSAQELQKPFDTDNPGVQRIVIKTKTEASGTGNFCILAVPEASRAIKAPAFQKLEAWSPPL